MRWWRCWRSHWRRAGAWALLPKEWAPRKSNSTEGAKGIGSLRMGDVGVGELAVVDDGAVVGDDEEAAALD